MLNGMSFSFSKWKISCGIELVYSKTKFVPSWKEMVYSFLHFANLLMEMDSKLLFQMKNYQLRLKTNQDNITLLVVAAILSKPVIFTAAIIDEKPIDDYD